MESLSNYWDNRWLNAETGWDVGYATPAIVHYMSQIENKGLSILIPGCGNAYEADFLANNGFHDITLLDISPTLVNAITHKYADTKSIKVLCADFFDLTGSYDIIIEQTFFCAIDPSQRTAYRDKMYDLLKPGGFILGVMFDKIFDKPGPPHGGLEEEYRLLFSSHFDILHMSACTRSIPARAGTELFVKLVKKI